MSEHTIDPARKAALADFVNASLRLHGLALSSGLPEAILAHAERNWQAYMLLHGFELPERLDAAPVYEA